MGVIEASHTVEIDAPLANVWEVAADVPASPAWQPSLESVDTLETDEQGRATLVETTADAKVKTTRQRLRFSYDGEPEGMSWVQEKGDVKSLEGSWSFAAIDDDRTRATYTLAVDPGRVLGMLVRGPAQDKVKDFLTRGAAEGLKEHVESSKG
jgi:uncharacterized membrane protein